MAQKIRSIELENGTVVNFKDAGIIQLVRKDNANVQVEIHSTDLESIRDTAKSNAKIEAGSNGTLIVNKEAVK